MSRKNISITNTEVEKILNEADNASKYIERAILFYQEALDHPLTKQDINLLLETYLTKEEMDHLLGETNKKVCILEQRYTQMIHILEDLAKYIFKPEA